MEKDKTTEVWLDIHDLNDDYQISNLGQIRRITPCNGQGSHKTYVGKILKTELSTKGYVRVCIYRNGKRKRLYIHRLVSKYFIPNPCNKKCIHHINHDKLDNTIDNLRWCDTEENNGHIPIDDVNIFLTLLDDNKSYTKQELKDILDTKNTIR